MRSRQVKRHDQYSLGLELSAQLRPVRLIQARQAVNLLHQQHVAGLAVSQQAEQLRPLESRPGLVLQVIPSNAVAVLLGELL
ncbi:hypothetical protein D9M68_939580 [compost metagenome]